MVGRIAFSLVLTTFFVAGSGSVMAAAPNTSGSCSRVGTWHGLGDSGIRWMVTDTPGSNATVGQFALEWVVIDPTLGGFFPTVVRATNALGVWQKVNQRKYKYTWIAYGLDAGGLPVFVARTSGVASMVDCDHAQLTYTLELFDPAQDMSGEPQFATLTGTATENRMALVQK